MSLRVLGLLLLFGCALRVWWVHGQVSVSCDQPLPYRLEHIDTRFGLSHAELREAVQQAEELWEAATGKNLLVYDADADLTINFSFDERQQTVLAGQRLANKLHQTMSSHASLAESYTHWRQVLAEKTQEYEHALAAYHARGEAYKATVDYWNARGGTSRQVFSTLETERQQLQIIQQQLDNDRAYLQGLVETVNTLAERSKTLTTTYKRQVKTYQQLYGENRQFHKGEYNGKSITIYQFHNRDDLTLVLAHELGHALGVGHVSNPEAVMHDFIGEQDLDPVALLPEDVRAWQKACQDH